MAQTTCSGPKLHLLMGLMTGHINQPLENPPPPQLGSGDVHIWYITTDREPLDERQALLEACLSAQEKDQYLGLKRPPVRQSFLLSRGCLRYLLGYYLATPANSLKFSFGPYGKPALGDCAGDPALQFNLSHTHDRIAIALHRRQSIGVDIEQLRPVHHLQKMSQRCLTCDEAKTFQGLKGDSANCRFLRYWTAKEALLKSLGVGLSLPMNHLEVALDTDELPGQPAQVPLISFTPPSGSDKGCFELYQWCPEPGYLAAIALYGCELGEPAKITLHYSTPLNLIRF